MIPIEASKKLLHAKVKHNEFGMGTLKEINRNMITINFETKGDKKFVYPDAFNSFLVMSDPVLNDIVIADIKRKKAEVESEKELTRLKNEEESLARENAKKDKKRTTTKPKVKS